MACFLVPAAEAVVATIATKVVEKKEAGAQRTETNDAALEMPEKLPFSRKLKWLTNLLWGGSVLLAFEHVWHGEVTPFFPFLTAAADAAENSENTSQFGSDFMKDRAYIDDDDDNVQYPGSEN